MSKWSGAVLIPGMFHACHPVGSLGTTLFGSVFHCFKLGAFMLRKPTIFLTLVLILGFSSTAEAAKLAVKSAAVMDFATGKILLEQNPYRKIPPASITKIMSMYLVFEAIEQGRIKLADTVKVSSRAADTGGSSMNLKAGETVTVAELLDGMAVASGNDACVAMAEYFGGVDAFVAMMNRKARELGMIDTTFVNPNGLPAEGQYTTARDMLKLSQSYLNRFPQALSIHSKRTITHNGRTRKNSNRLLGHYPGVDGIKTGWVNASGYNIVVTAKRGDTRIIAVVLGGKSWQVRNREASKAMDICFRQVPGGAMLAKAEEPAPSSVFKGKAQKNQAPKTRPAVTKASRRSPKQEKSTRPAQIAQNAAFAKAVNDPGLTIQESSWKSISEAKTRAKALQKKGMPAHIVSVDLGGKGVWHRVMIGSFDSRKDAEKYKKSMSKRYNLADAIIR